MKLINAILIGIGIMISSGLRTQNKSELDKSAFDFHVSYSGDMVSNFSGGIKQGTTYLGLANIKLGFDTEQAKLWKGGNFYINAANTHGGKPSELLVGDFLGISNIEAGNLTFLFELWYKQRLGKLDFTIGLQDMNANFAFNESALLFTNSSFGIHSSISDNISTPIFPLTALGLTFQWNISSDFTWQTAMYDGTPDDFDNNPLNLHWKLGKDDGFLAVSELQINKSLIKGSDGIYKFGIYYHEHSDNNNNRFENGGLYILADQHLSDKLSVFSQIGLSPKTKNLHNHYISLGATYKGLFDNRTNDQFGFALAYAGIDSSSINSETVVELTYLWQISENISVRPDLQYIINPAGTSQKLKNAFVGFIRFGFEL